MDIGQMVINEAQNQGVDPQLALEVALAESSLNPNAQSTAGAIGVMQLMPGTAAGLGVDPWDPVQNIAAGVYYLNQQINTFGDPATALAAYNWGPENVQKAMAKYGADWLAHAPAETRNYVQSILGNIATQYSVSSVIPFPNLPAAPSAAGSSISFQQIAILIGVAIAALFVLNFALEDA